MKKWVLVLLALSTPTVVTGINREYGGAMAVAAGAALLGLVLAVALLWKPR
jgi:hypothetical protein